MRRRGFLGAILTLAAAPAIVRASSLMPVRAPGLTPLLNGRIGFIDSFSFHEAAPASGLAQLMEAQVKRDALLADIWSKRVTEQFARATIFGQTALKTYPEGADLIQVVPASFLPRSQ